METNPAKKLGKLSLAILENFVESKLGDKFIKELRQDYDLVATITSALESAENRFITEFEDRDLSHAMFVDLSQKDRPELQSAVIGSFNIQAAPTLRKCCLMYCWGNSKLFPTSVSSIGPDIHFDFW